MRSISSAVLAVVAPALIVVATSCGSGSRYGTSSAPNTPAGAVTAASGSVRVQQVDDHFQPSSLNGHAASPLTVSLTNAGSVAHTFTIDGLGVDKTLAPGESATVTFTPAAAGTLTFYCRFHRSLGVIGTITVSGPGGSGSAPATPAPTAGSYSNGSGY